MPYQPAVLGTARLNNFRLDYLTADQAADRPTHIRIILGGIDITKPGAPVRAIYKSITIRDALFDTPNTCALTLYGTAAPNVGQPLEVWINSDAPVLLFGGELQTVDRTYKGRPATVLHPVTAIDDTARANRRRPLMRFANVSATTIAQTLIATYAPGFSSAGVEAGLPAVTITFDGSEAGMKGCLTALAKLIGGYWYFEYKTLYLFVTPPGAAPDPIDDTPGRFLHDPAITRTIDKSQVRTRVYGKGAGTQIATAIAAGESLVPLVNGEMFTAAGGQAIAAVTPDGAAFQVLTYTGVQLGGGGGLVGPGSAPSAVPALELVGGAGMENGPRGYKYTFLTAAGESLPSPAAAITVGTVAPPAVAPTPGAVQPGGSVDAGTHFYAVTFVTASGETTTPNVTQSVVTTVGSGIPTPGATSAAQRYVGGNLSPAVGYTYKTTFLGNGGETLPGGAWNSVVLTPPAAPGYVAAQINNNPGGNLTVDAVYVYAMSFVAGAYETALTPEVVVDLPPDSAIRSFRCDNLYGTADPRITARRLYRYKGTEGGAWQYRLVATIPIATITYVDGMSDADAATQPTRGQNPAAIGTPPGDQITVTVPLSGDPRTTGRKVYRADGAAAFRYLATINNNSATQYIDNIASVSTQPDAPVTDTTGGASYRTVPLSGIAIGPALVTARRIYRSEGGDYRLVTTIANNTQTTYTDTAATASLGALLPQVNTATANRVHVSVPLGPGPVTGRKLYRTGAGGSLYQFLQTIPDNTSIVILDAASDAVLTSAVPPTVDTSGLTQPSGQVSAGATAIIVANPAPFSPTGGWAVIGNGAQVIRYTGVSTTSLTGIPATGPGAIVASVAYNSTITTAPALVGVTGILAAIIRNSPIHVWVQRDDLAAQAAMIAYDGGGDGVYEHIWSDERRAEASLRQVCDAQLALYSRPLVTVTYAARDLKTKSGKTVAIALATPEIQESLTIQDVTITEIGAAPRLAPKFTVTASTVRQSFEAVLQSLIRKADA